jgi:hypothetical protein
VLQETSFGPHNSVDALAAMQATLPDLTPPTLSIDGPTTVRANDLCTWNSSVSGGNPPYTYAWCRNGIYKSGTASYTDDTGTAGFTLRLEVRDKYDSVGLDEINVSISAMVPPCLM